jgi:hypothetical protein
MELTELARKAIEDYAYGKDFEPDQETKEKFSKKIANFVTITKKGETRGRVGSFIAKDELWKSVIQNSINATFFDKKMSPLERYEILSAKIEISVLSKPKRIVVKNYLDLIKKIKKGMGLVLKQGTKESTVLPTIWEETEDKIEIMQKLSINAGLDKDAWKISEIYSYTTETFKEE